MRVPKPLIAALAALLAGLPACTAAPVDDVATGPAFACDSDDGGLSLPGDLCATVFADDLGAARHLAVSESGTVYVQRNPTGRRTEGGFEVENPGGVAALRDTDGDGKADEETVLNEVAGTGLGIHGGYLYYTSNSEVFRLPLVDGDPVDGATPEVVVTAFPQQAQHAAKTIAFDADGHLYVNVGAPSNACQENMRTPGSAGLDPCPQLELQAGIWRFDAAGTGQTQASGGVRYATGIRNAMGIAWNGEAGELFATQHGRDSLSQLWPDLYDDEASAETPAEELLRVTEGADFGWPYCYFDSAAAARVLAPEYGGDGTELGRCAEIPHPATAFPAHWAPNDLLFYRGDGLGERYDGGAFIAFHGSWNRMPLPQAGYNVAFVPFAGGAPAGDFEVLIGGFPQTEVVGTPGDAQYRPTGLAQGPDGSLYISDDRQGRIWRVRRSDSAGPTG